MKLPHRVNLKSPVKSTSLCWVFAFWVLSIAQASPLPHHKEQRHDFHTSIVQVEHNPKTKALEVSLRVFTDDLEKALSAENNGQRFRVENQDKNDVFVERYVRKRFKLNNAQGQAKAYSYIGKENEADATWIYIEIPLQEPTIEGFRLQNDLLMEQFDDQVNIVNVRFGGVRKSYIFNVKKTLHQLE